MLSFLKFIPLALNHEPINQSPLGLVAFHILYMQLWNKILAAVKCSTELHQNVIDHAVA